MMLRRLILPSLALYLLGISPLAAASPVVLEVGDKKVTAEEVTERLRIPPEQRFGSLPTEVQVRILQSLAVHLHLVQIAEKKYAGDKDVQKLLDEAAQKAPEDQRAYAREAALVQRLREDVLKERNTQKVLDEELQALKQRRSGEEYDLIFVSFADQAAAEAAAAKAKDAAALEALSKEGANLSAMGYVEPASLPDAVEKAVKELDKGEVSAPVDTGFGWKLFAVKDRRSKVAEVTEADINEAKGMLNNRLWMEYVGETVQNAPIKLTPVGPADTSPAKP